MISRPLNILSQAARAARTSDFGQAPVLLGQPRAGTAALDGFPGFLRGMIAASGTAKATDGKSGLARGIGALAMASVAARPRTTTAKAVRRVVLSRACISSTKRRTGPRAFESNQLMPFSPQVAIE